MNNFGIRNIRENLEFLFFFLAGMFLILSVLYYRVILKRLPKDLYFIIGKNDTSIYNIPIIIFVFTVILISIVAVYVCLRVLNDRPFKRPNYKITHVFTNIHKFIGNSLYTVFAFIVNRIPDGFDKVTRIIMKFYFNKISNYDNLLLFEYSIRSVICISFLYDVFINFQFNYFYNSLTLLILILILKIWIFNIKDWASNLETVKSHLVIEDIAIGTTNEKHLFSFKPEYENQGFDLKYHVEIYRNLLTISEYLRKYHDYKFYYDLRFNLLYYSLFLVGCLYILIYNLFYI